MAEPVYVDGRGGNQGVKSAPLGADLMVSEIGLGTMTFGCRARESDAFAIMDVAHQARVTLFDTADVYPA